MRALAALVCLALLSSACTLQETDQEKNRKLLLGAIDKAGSGAVEFGAYRHLTVTAADGTVTETKLEFAGIYQSKSFAGQLGLIDNKTDKEKAVYDYLVKDGQPYIKEAGTTVWRRPVPGDDLPNGDPGISTLRDTVVRALSVPPYQLTQFRNSKALPGYYHRFRLGLAARDIEALLGIKLSDGEEPLFLKTVSSQFSVITASVDERLAGAGGVISGTVPATRAKVSLEMQTIFLDASTKLPVPAAPENADPQKDREQLAKALDAADSAGTAFTMKGAFSQGGGSTAQIQAEGVLKGGRVAMRYSVNADGKRNDYDLVLADRQIFVRGAGQTTWSVAPGDGFTWLMPVVRLALLKQTALLSGSISSSLRVAPSTFESAPPPPPFTQPLFSGLVRDSGPGGSDNEYVVVPAPDQMAQLLLSDQSPADVEKYARTIAGEVDLFLYPFGNRLSAATVRLQLSEPRNEAYRSILFSAVFKPANVDEIAVPASAVRTTPAKIFNL